VTWAAPRTGGATRKPPFPDADGLALGCGDAKAGGDPARCEATDPSYLRENGTDAITQIVMVAGEVARKIAQAETGRSQQAKAR
jgi:hypothetical protein